ncbi:hypothetical protein KC19_9G118300 [Ceratodon purpureus]|uniref:Uncharacterized protein n=1 Tax=Ceratodon purpureus TaxID=3225 RepID=A0A8T0GUR8_CERPU|nr:hypothetical protein KC19_9G118300 [Ceratodon purpureus]KAG0562100.1 hypothetical protein KC19_9G118300 [Ceratodon purpureus]
MGDWTRSGTTGNLRNPKVVVVPTCVQSAVLLRTRIFTNNCNSAPAITRLISSMRNMCSKLRQCRYLAISLILVFDRDIHLQISETLQSTIDRCRQVTKLSPKPKYINPC